MATYGWGTEHSVEGWLFEEGHRFDFYQAVRMLELIYPAKHPVGDGAEPGAEVVRFRSMVGLAFPASEIMEIRPPANGEPAEMTVNFLGLAGVHGPLPMAYTELVLDRAWRKDTALRDFLDVFNHRLVSLMHRVRRQHRVGLDFRSPEQSHFASYLFSVIGLGTEGTRGRLGLEDRSLLYYAGILAERPRSMAGLEAILGDYLGVPVRGVQMCGRWLELEEDQWTAIGRTGRHQRLGIDTALGGRVWDQQGTFRLAIGPMPFALLAGFLPGGSALAPLAGIISFYAGRDLEYELDLIVERSTIPPLRLGTRGEASAGEIPVDETTAGEIPVGKAPAGVRLGWTSWLSGEGDEGVTVRIGWGRIEHELNKQRSR